MPQPVICSNSILLILYCGISDHIIPVIDAMLFATQTTREDGISRQWFSRMFYLAHSPFQITWSLDSHVAVPSKRLAEALEEFERSGLDFAVPSQLPNSFFCHNFAFVFAWNDRVQTLFVDWMINQLKHGITGDDQVPLCEAMGCAGLKYGLRYGVISSNWALAWLSLEWGTNNNMWRHRTTRIISGRAEMCHKVDVCEAANSLAAADIDRPHVLYFDSKGTNTSSQAVFSQSQMDNILPYKYSWNDWDSPQSETFLPAKFKCV